MDHYFQKRAASLLLLLWLTLVSAMMFLEFMNASTVVTISMENVLVIFAIGSILFLLILVIVRFLFTLLDWKHERAEMFFGNLMISVDKEGTVFLLPKNSTKVVEVRTDGDEASVQTTDDFMHKDMASFRLTADQSGNIHVDQPVVPFRAKAGIRTTPLEKERTPASYCDLHDTITH